MNDPKLYLEAHELQRKDAENFYEEFASKIQWRSDGLDTLIDVGSGPGDITADIIYPLMPVNFQRFVFSDIQPSMVEFSKQRYNHLEKSEFHILNIETSDDLPSDLEGKFDHVTSNYCLQLVPNLGQAFRNIYKLLRPEGGDILINTAPYVSDFEGYTSLSKQDKWSSYLYGMEKYTSSLQNNDNPRQYMLDLFSDIGFIDCFVETRERVYKYNWEAFKKNMRAASPYIHRIPVTKQDEFMDDYAEAMANLEWKYKLYNKSDQTIRMPYRQMVLYARKSPQ
uniref:Methyltransferase type 12 domain-containing protein n=1 Tax=Stomoxys calcitrans TaxID=35570 RepID=A0A1I8PXL7_STOCA